MSAQGETAMDARTLRQQVPWIALVFGLILLPHLTHLPLWVPVTFIVCVLVRVQLDRRHLPLPGRWLRVLAVVVAVLALLADRGTILGLEAGVALLWLMASFKLFELRGRRDAVVFIPLGLFLIAAQLLFHQGPLAIALMILATWALLTLLVAVTNPTPAPTPLAHGRLTGFMLLQALPLAVVLFLLFPRVPGPLWGLPEDGDSGMTGLSSEMSPGSISQLSQSDEVAFRVEFDDEPPPYRQRYWRGPVLSRYDGETWKPPQPWSPGGGEPAITADGEDAEYEYAVTLEASGEPWLLALDLPLAIEQDAERVRGASLRSEDPVRERTRYRARSTVSFQLDRELNDLQRDYYTRLPPDAHPRARDLVADWQQATDEPAALVERALDHFGDAPFRYTLDPPRLTGDRMDTFLFETRAGFCEHYAGAFTVLMRAADIPARVVTGYLGGEPNPAGDYTIVRQSDAHAWVEVWLAGDGWVRVDPTGAVAPARVDSGLGAALEGDDAVPTMARGGSSLWARVRLQIDAVNALWQRWVLAYGPSMQEQLLERLGLDTVYRWIGALAGAIGVLLAGLVVAATWRLRPAAGPPEARLWQWLHRRLARRGLKPRTGEGPRDLATRAATRWPERGSEMKAAAEHYIRLRYGRDPVTRDHRRALRSAIQRAVRRLPRRREDPPTR